MAKVVVMDHPLIQHKIGYIRRTDTGTKDFRQTIAEIANLICYEATRDLKLRDVEIQTPICKTTVKELAGKKLAIVPILRAGLGMVDGVLELVPAAKVGHIGLYRDPETLEPVEYYCKLPADCAQREVFVVDPMLATGGTAIDAISLVKKRNPNIKSPIICLVGPPGVGKTSFGMNVAKSLNKEFYKISVGGLNDTNELMGNRRTYIGSSPGKIMQALLKCGVNNPVILIDENYK